jgi:hypothetical protein
MGSIPNHTNNTRFGDAATQKHSSLTAYILVDVWQFPSLQTDD